MPSPKFASGHEILAALEKLYLIHPLVVNRQDDHRYWMGIFLTCLAYVQGYLRHFIGAFLPEIGLKIGNFFNIFGFSGQVMSFASGACILKTSYWRLRMVSERKVTFLYELLDYDDPKSLTILSGQYRHRMSAFMKQIVIFLKLGSRLQAFNILVGIFAVGCIGPILVDGLTINNVVWWSVNYLTFTVHCYYIAMDWVYVLGSWLLIKTHLDLEAESLIDRMIILVKEVNLTNKDVVTLDHRYRRLSSRIKRFDQLSSDLMSPFRLVLSFFTGVMIFAAHQQANLTVKIGMDFVVIAFYLICLVFLFTTSTLSVSRTKLYFLTNKLFIKASQQRSVGQMVILRRMVKSLGDKNRPTICLTDKSGQEFQPMEFVEFVFGTFSNFTLAATLFFHYHVLQESSDH